jgi:hypothetical protein
MKLTFLPLSHTGDTRPLGPEPQAGRRHPRASQGSQSFPLAGYVDLVSSDVHLHPGGTLELLHLG